jgi:general secretion pathway protein D
MMRYTPLLFLLLIATSAPAQQPPAVPPGVPVTPRLKPPAKPVESDNVTITFPKNSVLDVIAFYEVLTGKRIIRDSNLAGQELSIMISKPVSREDAIAIIESSLLLNNYSLVPVDGETVKILGPSRAPRTEGVPILSEETLLPQSDQVLSFYKPLAFLTPEDAIAVLQGVIQMNAYGSLVPVPNTNAVIITDKTALIEKALAVLKLIDVEPARVVTEFVTLRRANAEKVVEMLDAMFTKNEGGKQGSGASVNQAQGKPAEGGGQAPPPAQAAAGISNARYENNLVTGQAKFLADKRTNRVLVVTRVENYRYVREVISNLDAAADFEQPFTRKLKYVPVTDILPVLSDMLGDPDSEKQVSGAEGDSQQQRRNQNQGFGNNTQRGRNNSDAGSGLDRPDRLANETEQGAPQAVTIGEIRLIADSNANSIVVFGPPESKLRTQQILDILDQRPKQVYLAVVIGQLRLGKGLDYGVSYFIRNKGFEPLNNLIGNSPTSGFAATAINPNMLPGGVFPNNPLNITDPSALPTLSGLSGLTVYGTIADSVDIFARFLETTNRFKTLSRPVVYTTNNRKATILSGQKVPVPTQALTTATGGGITGNGSSITSNIQYQDVVLKLEVVPLINSDGEVNLVIAQTNDNIVGRENISGNQVPVIATQEITTSVRVPNGTTIVLGGLISEEKDEGKEGIPYISEIPIVGSLLGGRTQDKIEKRELIVMIQPVVVDSNEDMLKASAYEGDRTPLGMDGQAMTAPLAEQPGPPSVFRPEKKKKSFWPWSKPEYD